MTATEILARCSAAGIRLQPASDGLEIDAPSGALTAELVAELRANKAALLAMLRPTTATPAAEVPGLDHDAQPDALDFGPDGWPAGAIEPQDCPSCPALLTWQDAAGRWRCETCDADALARSMQLADAAARARQRHRARGPSVPRRSPQKTRRVGLSGADDSCTIQH
jgi:hypothetical protein